MIFKATKKFHSLNYYFENTEKLVIFGRGQRKTIITIAGKNVKDAAEKDSDSLP